MGFEVTKLSIPAHDGAGTRDDAQLTWLLASSSHFTTQSAYELIDQDQTDQGAFKWKHLWKLKGPPYGTLLWLIAQGRLKTKELLCRRQILESPTHDICECEPESNLHAVKDSELPRAVWQRLLPPLGWVEFWNHTNPQDWLTTNLQGNGEPHWKDIFNQTIQELWHCRNMLLFQQKAPPSVACLVRNILERTWESQKAFSGTNYLEYIFSVGAMVIACTSFC